MYPNTPNQSQPSPQWQPPMPPPSSYSPPPPSPPPYPPEPQLPDPQPPETEPVEPPEPSQHPRKRLLGVAATVLAVVLLATGTYFFFLRDRIGNTGNAEQETSNATPLSSQKEVALIPPADLSRYRANTENSATNMKYVSEDGSCSLRIAVQDKDDMPGSNVNELAANHIKDLRDDGFTVTATRDNEPALELKGMSDPNKTYSLQTVAFEASHNGKYVTTHMSAAILADGKRAQVARTCEADEKRASQEKLAPINADAAKVAVLAK